MDARVPNWGDLAVFLATTRAGSLASAGVALGVNASTVQRRVGKLEASLGTRLFDRSHRGYALTAAGEELLAHALAVEAEVTAAERRIGGRDARLEGVVRVTTVDDFAVGVLTPIVRDFHARHPGVTVDVDVQSQFSDLSRREADVAVRFGIEPDDPDVIVKHLTRVDVAMYASRGYVQSRGLLRDEVELRAHPTVRASERFRRLPVEQWMEKYGDRGRVALRSGSMLVRFEAVRAGIGIGWLGCFMAEVEPELVRLPFLFDESASDLWMLVHVDLRRNARVRAFVEFAYDAIVDTRSRFLSPA